MKRPGLYVAAFCAIEALSMVGFAAFPTLLPAFQREWSLSETEAGWISGVYFVGYVAAVAVLTSLTDRIDARWVVLASLLLGSFATLGFALDASGVWSASGWRVLQGIAVAGGYMPGLKALTDRLPERHVSRATAFYTSSFGVGASLSYYLSGKLGAAFGWETTFAWLALGPLVAFALALVGAHPSGFAGRRRRADRPVTHLLDFRPVFANRRAVGFTLAYAAHNAELFAFRSWIVAFLVFAQAQQAPSTPGAGISAATVAAALILLSMPASVAGNELAARIGRQWTTVAVMVISAAVGSVIGFLWDAPMWAVIGVAVVYAVTVAGESATVTAGVVKVADPRYKGATMAMHSVVGFLGAIAGPMLFGVVLDLAGGAGSGRAWGLAFASSSAVVLLGPVAITKLVGLQTPVR